MKSKILFILNSFGGGGAEKVLLTILHHFDYSQYDVTLCLLSQTGCLIQDLPESVHRIFVYNSPNNLLARIGFVLYSRLRIDWIERMAMRAKVCDNYDTIVSFVEGRSLKFHGFILDRARRNLTWVHCNLYEMGHYTIGPVLSERDEKNLYERMDAVAFVSSEAERQFAHFKYNIKNSIVIHNPIDVKKIQVFLNNREEDIVSPDIFTIVLCGGLKRVKAFDRIIRVAKKLVENNFHFCVKILGEGEDYDMLQTMIDENFLIGIVQLVGFKYPPYQVMSQANLFVNTSLSEGYPGVICEALCLGLPIVATRCSGNVEILGDNNEYGMIAEQNDESIYQCIKKMIMDESLRLHYRQKALSAANQFDVAKTMSAIYSVLS